MLLWIHAFGIELDYYVNQFQESTKVLKFSNKMCGNFSETIIILEVEVNEKVHLGNAKAHWMENNRIK